MQKFLRWLMKLFSPDSSGFVKNIQTGSETGSKQATSKTAVKGKKIINAKESLFWVPTSKVIEVEKNGQGYTDEIHLASGTVFLNLDIVGNVKVVSKKQGLSKVSHHLEMKLAESDGLLREAQGFEAQKTNITILHIDRYGSGFLYGESTGLFILEQDGLNIVLEGSEDNVFYEMTKECLNKVVPNKE